MATVRCCWWVSVLLFALLPDAACAGKPCWKKNLFKHRVPEPAPSSGTQEPAGAEAEAAAVVEEKEARETARGLVALAVINSLLDADPPNWSRWLDADPILQRIALLSRTHPALLLAYTCPRCRNRPVDAGAWVFQNDVPEFGAGRKEKMNKKDRKKYKKKERKWKSQHMMTGGITQDQGQAGSSTDQPK